MLKGEIVKIQSQKENDWGRYTIDSYGKRTLAVGVIPGATLGMTVTLEGGMETNKYGTQYKISEVLSTTDDEFSGIRTFLSDGYVKGIGLKTANQIIRMYGKNCLDLFDNEEGRKKLEAVPGLGKRSIKNALPSYKENKKYKDIVLFLNGAGTKGQIEKIYEKFGKQALKTLKTNPYCLQMELDGFGFRKADAIALATGIKKDSLYRIMAGIKFVLEEAQSAEGHCYLPIDEIRSRVIPLLVPTPKCKDISDEVANNALENWDKNKETLIKSHDPSAATLCALSETAESRELINESLVDALNEAIEEKYLFNEEGNIYTEIMHNTEVSVAKLITDMRKGNAPVRKIHPETIEAVIEEVEQRKTAENEAHGKPVKFEITEEQRRAVYLGLMNRICIISGGPGRGKTAISEIIAKTFLKSGLYYDKSDILMLAPTGKAARRITESTGYYAMTVHRAVLSVKDKEELPKGKLILVDESSMVDIFLMLNIMKFSQYNNLIFVGDVNQIASVGPGKVLKDLIDSETIPCIILKEGHRNSGSIARNSESINAGLKHDHYLYDEHFVYMPFQPVYKKTATGALIKDDHGEFAIERKATEIMQQALVSDYMKNVEKYGFSNVMLCVAMKERGDVCTSKLNNAIQELNTHGKPTAEFSEKRKFRVGDRVMQIKNDYQFIKMSADHKLSKGVCNGETGTVAQILPDPENDSFRLVVQFDDGCTGGYTKATIQNLQLAYAITVHKCQGSEAKCVMMAYSFSDYMLLNRSLFYTGVTRSSEICYLYGEERFKYGKMQSAFDVAVSRAVDIKRYTMLSDRLKDLAAA